MDFIKENTKKFDCTITPHIGNFAHLINNKIFYVYILKSNDTIMACYLLEEQQNEKTGHVTEEVILYSFLGVFIIFVLDSFARAGKYIR